MDVESFNETKHLGVDLANQSIQRLFLVYWDTRWCVYITISVGMGSHGRDSWVHRRSCLGEYRSLPSRGRQLHRSIGLEMREHITGSRAMYRLLDSDTNWCLGDEVWSLLA